MLGLGSISDTTNSDDSDDDEDDSIYLESFVRTSKPVTEEKKPDTEKKVESKTLKKEELKGEKKISFLLPKKKPKSYKIVKVSNNVYHIEFDYGFNKIIFDIGIGYKRYAKFKTKDVIIETSKPTIINCNDSEYTINRDSLADSIHRYYGYYLYESGDRIFYSNDFHRFILKMVEQNYD